jgi:hypothetical protein
MPTTGHCLASKDVVSVIDKAWIVSYLCQIKPTQMARSHPLAMMNYMYHKRLRIKVSSSN